MRCPRAGPETRAPTWISSSAGHALADAPGRHQVGTILLGVAFGITWMVAQALMPYTIGRGIQDGVVANDASALVPWALLLLGLGIVQGTAGVLRHRYAVQNWLQASFLLVQVVSHHAARTGPAVRVEHPTGEVVATAGGAFDITARGAGAIVSYACRTTRSARGRRSVGSRMAGTLRSKVPGNLTPPATVGR